MNANSIDTLLSGLDWQPVDHGCTPPQDLHATHSGVLEIVGLTFRCFRLSDGRAVIHMDDLDAFMAGVVGGTGV